MWLYRAYSDPDTLVPDDEVSDWSRALRNGKAPSGESIKAVHYVFKDEGTAEYNHHALAFARLGTYHGSLDNPKPYDGATPSFDTKEDFGIS